MRSNGRASRERLAWFLAAGLCVVALATWWAWDRHRCGGDLESAASSDEAARRIAAARELADRDSDAARNLLLRMIDDSNPAVASQAVESLGIHRDPARREVVAQVLAERHRPVQVRAMAAATYGRFDHADPAPLIDVLGSGDDPLVRAGAARGLTRLRDPRSLPALVRTLEDGDQRVRLWAISAIHNMTTRRFPYDAAIAPAQQREVIQRIKDYMRSGGIQGIE